MLKETDNKLSVTRIHTKSLAEVLTAIRGVKGTVFYVSVHFNDTAKSYNGSVVFKPSKEIKRKE